MWKWWRIFGVFPLLWWQLAAAQMFIIQCRLFRQIVCSLGWVGKRVYKCANSAHYVASFLQEILFAAISDLKDGNGEKATSYSVSFLLCVGGSADCRTSYAFVLIFSCPAYSRFAREWGKDLAPVWFVVLFSGSWNALVEKCARAAPTKLFWVFTCCWLWLLARHVH